MRPANKNRSRNKSSRKSVGNVVNRVFDSAGPEGKVRGTPQQIIEKYQALARDAQLSNDRVAAENFLQHSEHYTRLLLEAQRQIEAQQGQRRDQDREGQGGDDQPEAQTPQQGNGHDSSAQQQQPAALETVSADDSAEDSTLVETPESAPRRSRGGSSRRGSGSRRSSARSDASESDDGGSDASAGGDDTPKVNGQDEPAKAAAPADQGPDIVT